MLGSNSVALLAAEAAVATAEAPEEGADEPTNHGCNDAPLGCCCSWGGDDMDIKVDGGRTTTPPDVGRVGVDMIS